LSINIQLPTKIFTPSAQQQTIIDSPSQNIANRKLVLLVAAALKYFLRFLPDDIHDRTTGSSWKLCPGWVMINFFNFAGILPEKNFNSFEVILSGLRP
jgi:hypothetical protein